MSDRRRGTTDRDGTGAVRRRATRQRVVFDAESALSGRIRVVDQGDERRLVANGHTLSAISLSGDWSGPAREYWGRALGVVKLPRRPAALFVGLGGGTQLRLIADRVRPRLITAVERDPAIIQVALRYFGLARLPRTEILCGDVERVLPSLEWAGRRFDFIMEDAVYGDSAARALSIARRLAALLAAGGTLVSNRNAHDGADAIAAALRETGARVWLRRVRRDRDNVLICAATRAPGR
jgi:hypothetical protein